MPYKLGNKTDYLPTEAADAGKALEDTRLLQGYPAELVKLMRAATALDPNDRPYPMEFGRLFEAAL